MTSNNKDSQEGGGCLLLVFFIAYVVPALLAMIINFVRLVIFGDVAISTFDWGQNSFGIINDWYIGIFEWFKGLYWRMTH